MKDCNDRIKLIVKHNGEIKSRGKLRLPVTVGRSKDNKILIQNALAISKHHLTINKNQGKIEIIGHSKNGFFLNNKFIRSKFTLNEGDVIHFLGLKYEIYIESIVCPSSKKKDASDNNLMVKHNRSKAYQSIYFTYKKIQEQFYLQRYIYILGILIIIGLFTFIIVNIIHEKKTPIREIITIKKHKKEKGHLSDKSTGNENIIYRQRETIKKNKIEEKVSFNIEKLRSDIGKDFKNEIVEIYYKNKHNEIIDVVNGYYYKSSIVAYFPFSNKKSLGEIKQIVVRFKGDYEKTIISKGIIDYKNLHFAIIKLPNTSKVTFSNHTIYDNLSHLKHKDRVIFVEFNSEISSKLFVTKSGSIAEEGQDEIICNDNGNSKLRHGAIALSSNKTVMGLVTELGNHLKVKPLNRIYKEIIKNEN